MRLDPLYRARFSYPEGRAIELSGRGGTESQWFFIAEGRCEGYPRAADPGRRRAQTA